MISFQLKSTAEKDTIMPVQIESEADDVYVLRISGLLKQSEFSAEQSVLARKMDSGLKPRLLVILENFEGWERGADWNDLDFMISHGGEIAKIAILAFAGAGIRRAPVKFFPLSELQQARSWLAE